ncbi:uncharacterized protein LOC108161459 [Drosophila miranda]|uniref:uncharacterized protein LOC108161459 n=1 Tax=Drosophila miranda TaxID=7229 RepID=UPI0007E7F4ED|nr:uncharacterized protein LOC108161459 [Drosophila miranda]
MRAMMFRQINSMCMVMRSLTRGEKRHLSVVPLLWNKSSSQNDGIFASKSEEGWSTEAEQFGNRKKLNRREALRKMMRDNSIEQQPGEDQISEHGPWVPPPCYRGPEVKMMPEKEAPKDEKKLKLNRRFYLRQMCKASLMNPKVKKPIDDMQIDSIKINRESLNPARVESLKLKWKERQEEIEKRRQEAGKNKYVSRFEMNTGRMEKIK